MRTFSEIVDQLMATASLPDISIQSAAIHVNNAINDANLDNRKSAWDTVEFYYSPHDLIGGRRGYLPSDYLAGLEVEYDNHPDPIPQRKLGSVRPAGNKYWYQSGRDIIFAGNRGSGVKLAYQRHNPVHQYFRPELRLLRTAVDPEAIFEWRANPDAEWTPFNPSDDRHVKSYRIHSSWLLEQWGAMVLTGARSYALNEYGNLNEGGRLYNAFRSQLTALSNTE